MFPNRRVRSTLSTCKIYTPRGFCPRSQPMCNFGFSDFPVGGTQSLLLSCQSKCLPWKRVFFNSIYLSSRIVFLWIPAGAASIRWSLVRLVTVHRVIRVIVAVGFSRSVPELCCDGTEEAKWSSTDSSCVVWVLASCRGFLNVVSSNRVGVHPKLTVCDSTGRGVKIRNSSSSEEPWKTQRSGGRGFER